MESADIGRRQQVQLLFQEKQVVFVFSFAYCLADCPFDFFLHFGSCCVGESHNKHAVDRASVLQNQLLYALDKNSSLAGTGRCRN